MLASRTSTLVVNAGSHGCAIPTVHVLEIMRPLPIVALAGMPPFVLGLSVIRGYPLPVVHLGHMVGAGPANAFARYVTVLSGKRPLALAVDAVLGIRELDAAVLAEPPPLVGQDPAGLVESACASDERLLFVLQVVRILPEPMWKALEGQVGSA